MFNLSELLIWVVIVSLLCTMTFRAGTFLLDAAREASSYNTAIFFPDYDLY